MRPWLCNKVTLRKVGCVYMNYHSLLSLQLFLLGWKEGKEKATLGVLNVEERKQL